MNLTQEEISMIKSSFSNIQGLKINLAQCFYNNLFEMAPLIKPMFISDAEVIEMHFNEIIHLAVREMEAFEDLKPKLFALGATHQDYGIKPAHFEVVRSALLLTIEYELKLSCHDTVIHAWSKYIDNISKVMIDGLLQYSNNTK
ncbi:hypothetical protein HQQ94_15850 [Shewanella sp. VB17]|uniref:globin domain-containing protein n=1 Tax=Shewanella sp. VB17 TaxID=2739432 RepID=UPI0015640744|nr:globin domain-containing protein [Shewanella sp. VB17]NRD74669.1 hypothetical protein [Shewanella sp. VB17]